jgi:Uma2 family endonuclease
MLIPAPGTATYDDAADSRHKIGVNCELVEGVLVAKTMGWYESRLAIALAHFLELYLDTNPIGIVAGGDGPVQTNRGNVRKPDIAFVSFNRLPNRKIPRKKILPIAPDLAVEILSDGNTPQEMEKKLREYFEAGVLLVWYIEPELQLVRVYTAVDQFKEVRAEGMLRGGGVLPGFEISLKRLFEKAGPREAE